MFKKQQKWIALLLTFTFVWLLQVSALPLVAADKPDRVGPASVEQEPGFIEQQGPEWNQARKKSPARIIIIVIVGYVALSLLYFLIYGIPIEAAPNSARSSSGGRPGTDLKR